MLFFCLALLCSPAPVSLLLAVVLHEAGHILCAALFGWGLPRICESTCGLRLVYVGERGWVSSLCVALSGSLFGCFVYLFPFFSGELRVYSLGLSIVSLFPVSGLDGGTVMYTLLDRLMLPDRIGRVVRVLSVCSVLLLFIVSCSVHLLGEGNPTLLVFCVYLTVTVLGEK